MSLPALLAVDGGGSKVDAALLSRTGAVLGTARVRNTDHDGTGGERHLDGVVGAVASALRAAGRGPGLPAASLGVYCLAGADLPADDRRLDRWLAARGWSERRILRNDTFAVLRAGTDRGWGVAVVCGFGTNCAAVTPAGRTFRLPAVGEISGDWGGGYDIGAAALWHAIRARDGRGARTALADLVPAHFGLRRPRQVMEAMYFGRIPGHRVVELAPLVFRAATAGDAVARGVIDRQADEVGIMVRAAVRRLGIGGDEVDVVLGGGIFRNEDPAFHERVRAAILDAAPRARITRLSAPPILGAALIGLDALGATTAARARVRRELTHARMGERDTLSAGRAGPAPGRGGEEVPGGQDRP